MRLRVMTFNVRYDTPADGPNAWPHRRDIVARLIKTYDPDVVGLQEVLEHQGDDITERLPDYAFLGKPREPGGEFVPLLYKCDLAKEQDGVFWLSDTPDIEATIGWDADVPRIATWAVLRKEHRAFLITNTHLDRWGVLARARSADVLLTRMSRFAGLPQILTGDLNSTKDDPPVHTLAAGMLRDTYTGEDVRTVHDFGCGGFGHKIDFVLADPNWRVLDARVITDKPDDRWPSDHYPVSADLELIDDVGASS